MLNRYALLRIALLACWPSLATAQTPLVAPAGSLPPIVRQLPPGRFPAARAKVDPTVNLTFKINGEVVSAEQQIRPVGELFANYTVSLDAVKLQTTNQRNARRQGQTSSGKGNVDPKATTDLAQAKRDTARQREERAIERAIRTQQQAITNNNIQTRQAINNTILLHSRLRAKYIADSINFSSNLSQIKNTRNQINNLSSNKAPGSTNARNQEQINRLYHNRQIAWNKLDSIRAELDSTRKSLTYSRKYLNDTVIIKQKQDQINSNIQQEINNLITNRNSLVYAVWLVPREIAIDQTNFDAYAVAHHLLLALRQDADSYYKLGGTLRSKRKTLGTDSRWAALLFPHGSLWPWRWHWPGRKYNRIGTRRERQVVAAFEHRLAQQLNAQWQPTQSSNTRILSPRRDSAQTAASIAAIGTTSSGGNVITSLPLANDKWLYLKPSSIPGQQQLVLVDRPPTGLESEIASVELSPRTSSNISAQLAADLQAKAYLSYQNQYRIILNKLLIAPEAENANIFISTFDEYQKNLKSLKIIRNSIDSLDRLLIKSSSIERTSNLDTQLDQKYRIVSNIKQVALDQEMQLQNMINKSYYLNNTNYQSIESHLSGVATQLLSKRSKITPNALSFSDLTENIQTLLRAAQPATPATAAVGENGDLIYHGQLLLPTSPVRRVAHVYIRDRGEGAAAQQKPRYVVCLQYSATVGNYQDLTVSSAACTPPRGYLGISAELSDLERTAFVETLSDGLDKKDILLEAAAAKVEASDATKAAEHRAQKLGFRQTTPAAGTIPVAANPTTEQIKEVLRDFYDNYLRSIDRLAATPYAGAVLMGQRIAVYQDTWGMAGLASQSPILDGQTRAAKARAVGSLSGRLDRNTRNVSEQPQQEYFLVDSVQVEIEDGNMMALKAHGRYRDLRVLFESYAPIGLSSDSELKKWYNQRLYAQSSFKRGFARDTGSTGKYDRLRDEYGLYIYLDDLMRYHPLLSPRAGDRSPADAVYTFRPQDALDKRVLHRTPTAKILQARVYSDLVGITNDRPNGLIQAELIKRIILNGHFNRSRSMPMAWGHYVCPLVSLNKIEQNNRRLDLTRVSDEPNSTDFLNRTVRTIDLLRHTYLRVGLAQNVITVRVPRIKSDFSFDMSGYLNRVAAHDTILPASSTAVGRGENLNLTVLSYGPQITWRVRPDSRWGFQSRIVSFREMLLNNRDDRNSPTRSIRQFPLSNELELDGKTVAGDLLRGSSQNILQYELLFWTSTSANSELFFRTQFSHLRRRHHHAYFQLQIGYQFDVFTNRRTAVMPAGLFPAK